MNDENDNLTGIFDDLTPDDFLDGASTPVATFHRFVESNVESVRKAYVSADGQINVLSVLDDGTGVETIIPAHDDENLGQYVQRVREEARARGAQRIFISRRSPVASRTVEVSEIKPVDKMGVNPSEMVDGIIYYAERREGEVREARTGILIPLEGGRFERTEIDARLQPIELFANMLG